MSAVTSRRTNRRRKVTAAKERSVQLSTMDGPAGLGAEEGSRNGCENPFACVESSVVPGTTSSAATETSERLCRRELR